MGVTGGRTEQQRGAMVNRRTNRATERGNGQQEDEQSNREWAGVTGGRTEQQRGGRSNRRPNRSTERGQG